MSTTTISQCLFLANGPPYIAWVICECHRPIEQSVAKFTDLCYREQHFFASLADSDMRRAVDVEQQQSNKCLKGAVSVNEVLQ